MDEDRLLSKLNVVNTLRWVAAGDEEGLRLDVFLARHLPAFSRRERALLIAHHHVLLNDQPAPKGATLHANDRITARVTTILLPQPTLSLPVVYSDAELVVVNKPAGMPSVAVRHTDTHTVANFLAAHFPETITAGARPLDTGLVHRLDTETSGLLLAARTPYAYAALREQFRDHTVGKDYIAVVEGRLKTKGQITRALAPTGVHGRRMHTVAPGQGQPALTFYAPVEHCVAHTVVRLTIVTGVRHQIRAHLAALGHPIVGDRLYGTQDAQKQQSTRLCLHAETLTICHPITGQTMKFTSPVPEDFSALQRQLRQAARGDS